ncbi:hypothetical protein N0V90_003324 [Kalmusia sp. IMI 367209]|nr:hypothetical protein N0V90_003324 [Kalmusia sp. IMI 367209]
MGRPRGSKNKKITSKWEVYKPAPEVYDGLFRLHKAPPTITHRLPKECPLPNAKSTILSRRQTDDGFARNYYLVQISELPIKASNEPAKLREEVLQVDMSQILKYVSRRELERFEQADFAAVAQAEAVARRAEADELARRKLEKNARERGFGRGNRMLRGLGLDSETQVRSRGRPRGRGKGRGRGRGRGLARCGLTTAGGQDVDAMEKLQRRQSFQIASIDTEDVDGEDNYEISTNKPSPSQARNSLLTNSALPNSPIATHRRQSLMLTRRSPIDDDSNSEEDGRSRSDAVVQLQFERDKYGRNFLGTESDGADDHRTKRRRTEDWASTSALIMTKAGPTSPKQSFALTHSLSKSILAEKIESSASESSTRSDDRMLHMRQPVFEHSAIPSDKSDAAEQNIHDGNTEDDREEQSGEEFVVEAILSHSYEDGKKYYLVKWDGYEDSSDWLPEEDLLGTQELLTEYNEKIEKRKVKGSLHRTFSR